MKKLPVALMLLATVISVTSCAHRSQPSSSITPAARRGNPQVKVIDTIFDTAGAFLAYTEFELSGEPLAENLGLDLDTLDPNALNQPTAFDYAAGIESYEYSEEAMYALNFQSQMGSHLANGPVNLMRGGTLVDLEKRIASFGKFTSFPEKEIPKNLYPLSLPYASGSPQFAQTVNSRIVSKEQMELEGRTVQINIPGYFSDFKTLSWIGAKEKIITPAAIGGIFLKEVMWAQDFLGGMHTIKNDEEVEAVSPTMDQDGRHALGVSAGDGFNGLLLTEQSWDKLLTLQNQLAYDGKTLGVSYSPGYDARSPVWFPHAVEVEETTVQGVKAIGGLKVSEGHSSLRDIWLLLWPASEFYAFSDPREGNAGQNPSFRALFDGNPFPVTPKENKDADPKNDVTATDPFSLVNNLSNLLFTNLEKLHFNKKAGTFVNRSQPGGAQGSTVQTFDAAYAIVALSVFQRAQDALPVGYASAEAGKGLETPQGKRALALIRKQAGFILANLLTKEGLVADGYEIGKGADESTSLETQFAAIRGLTTAFIATKDVKYKEAARKIYLATDKLLFDKSIKTWASRPGRPTDHTPFTAAAISGGLRDAMVHLRAGEGEHLPALSPQTLTKRYTGWFRGVINGPKTGDGLQLAEWLADTGELVLDKSGNTDSDADGVPQITAAGGRHGIASVMAGKVRVEPGK